MPRNIKPHLFAAALAIVAVVAIVSFHSGSSRGNTARTERTRLAPTPVARVDTPAAESTGRRARDRFRMPPRPPQQQYIAGHMVEELEAKGITPMRMHASRQGARLQVIAQLIRARGYEREADEAERLTEVLWSARDAEDELLPDWGELITAQLVLRDRLVVIAMENRDDQVLGKLVLMVSEDVERTMSGDVKPVEDKLLEEAEDPEEQRRAGDDDEDKD